MLKSCLREPGYKGPKKNVQWSKTGVLIKKDNTCVTQRLDDNGKMQFIEKPERPSIPKEFVEQTPYATERAELQGSLEILGKKNGEPSWVPVWVKLVWNCLSYYPSRTVRLFI